MVRFRFRSQNAVRDLFDRVIRLRCCRAPLARAEGGYHFWRCGLRLRHRGPCQSGHYFWGPGGSVHDPRSRFVGGCDRKPVETRRQRRWRERYMALIDMQRERMTIDNQIKAAEAVNAEEA
jgi:hypothetical protein